MNGREHQLAAGMIAAAGQSIQGIRLRPFSYGSMQLSYMLGLSLFTGEDKQGLNEAETQRQIVTFAWMQSAPLDEVIAAVREQRVDEQVLRYSLGVPFEAIPALLAEINRIGAMIEASNVRVESKHPSTGDDPPGKS
jgi:hypothetical protein